MAKFSTFTAAARTDGQKVLVNLDLVTKVVPHGANVSRIHFAGGTDYVDVVENQVYIALETLK